MAAQMQMLQLRRPSFQTASTTVATQPCKFVSAVKYGIVKNIAFASGLLHVCKQIFACPPHNY